MLLLSLARKSLFNRMLTTMLTLASIALSVALLLGVENVRLGMRESFSNTISRTDLVVGSRGGSIQILLYSVFGMGTPGANISWATYSKWNEHPAVAWTIPYSLGDSHRGFRVIGTNESFYEHYRYRRDRGIEFAAGAPARGVYDVVVGHEVARRLGYSVGDAITVSHGLSSTGFMDHDDKPFTITGIMTRTGTPIDRAVYITLEGISAVHVDWDEGAPPMLGEEIPAEEVLAMDLTPAAITSFFVGTRNRMETLRLQRDISTDEQEPLTAIMPAVALAEMWRGIGYAEEALKIVTAFVVVVGLLGMLVALYTSLDARRREMAILRAVGAGPRRIIGLLVLESGMLAFLGAALGTATIYGLLVVMQGVVENMFGVYLPIRPPTTTEITYIAVVIGAGILIGLIPAWKAYRNALVDGLSVKM
jgi:putative ABC transport system permease protein